MLLHGEEKKDGGSTIAIATTTPNPLAAVSAPSASVAWPHPPQPQDKKSPPPPPAAAAPLGKTPAGVPNPIMMNSSMPFETSPIQVASQMADESPATSVLSPLATGVLSPLASPILTMDQQPPRPDSTLTVGTSASTMDAMASALDHPMAIDGTGSANNSGGELAGGGEDNYEPPTARRRRANTIHWATTPQQSATLTNSPNSLQNNETLQPVNFGDQHQAVNFSPGSGDGQRKPAPRKLSSASSSGSLYSEYSCDSSTMGSAGGPPNTTTTTSGVAMGTTTANSRPGASIMMSGTAGKKPAPATKDRRQKRLERNRESARASRRRRKQYLEELEVKVTHLSTEMDRGRLNHACVAVRTVRGMRMGKLREVERGLLIRDGNNTQQWGGGASSAIGAAPASAGGATIASHGIKHSMIKSGIQHNVTKSIPTPTPINRPLPPPAGGGSNNNVLSEQQTAALTGNLSRTSDELQIVQTFMKQQLLSLVQPNSTKFALWLSLQKDGFYRGGRSASERLSAARIGERLLHGGTYRATPNDGMWPLTCHEIGLSYDQEERIRQTQRAVLADSDTWIHRHTALAKQNVLESVHTAIGGAQQAAKRREKSLMGILTPEQRVKFLSWASRRSEVLRRLAESKIGAGASGGGNVVSAVGSDDEYQTSPDRHVAANLYIIDHQLSKVKQRAPLNTPSFVHPSRLKKLSRRPSFESLAGQQGESDGNSKLNRETSFPSTGSLKRSLGDMAVGDNFNDPNSPASDVMMNSSQNSITPEAAQAAGHAAVIAVLKDVMPIIPKSVLPYPQHPHYTAFPLQPTVSSQPVSVPSRPLFQPQIQKAPPKPQTQPMRSSMPHPIQYAAPTSATAISVPMAAPPPDPEEVDIPMPTPVSVLLQTADDFFMPPPMYQQEEPLDALGASTPVADFVIPEQVTSYAANPTTPTVGLLNSNRHQSAPDFSYHTSLLPAPMAMIPESTQKDDGDIVDFAFEDFPGMEADDWAIGEGFDMDVDQGAQGAA